MFELRYICEGSLTSNHIFCRVSVDSDDNHISIIQRLYLFRLNLFNQSVFGFFFGHRAVFASFLSTDRGQPVLSNHKLSIIIEAIYRIWLRICNPLFDWLKQETGYQSTRRRMR